MHRTPVNRHIRALRILNCLQSGPQFSAKDFATLFGVSRRTIFRDLELLRDAGIDVRYDDRCDAYIVSSNSIRPPTFHMEDVKMLALSSNLSMLASWPQLGTANRHILSKLLASYPQRVRSSVSRLMTSCIPETTAPFNTRRDSANLELLFLAIQQRNLVRLGFQNRSNITFTKVAPYRVILGQGRWTLIGRSTWHRRTTRFENRRVHQVELTDEVFTMPRGFRFRSMPM